MDALLEVQGLKKSYGNLEAVRGIDFRIEPGEIYALIGPNGAGKTTTLRMVATILKPSGGTIEVDGIDVARDPDKVRKLISYLPEEAGAYKNMRASDYLEFVAQVFFADRRRVAEAVALAREVSGLGDRLGDKLGSYSKGMIRKLLLARTVMTKPKLAILDEPTSGLDVLNALEIRDRIRELARQGMSVLLSSHNMLEIEYLADRVGIIDHGVIRDTGTSAELKERYAAENLEAVFGALAGRPPRHAEQGTKVAP
ncbi:MAG: ABC transporter ATP-binding protein [Coriobacteriia bacterium]